MSPRPNQTRTHPIVFLLILAMFLLFGCTGEMTKTEKNICVSMSSKSYAYVPNCETVNSCFEKVDSLFSQNLGYSQESTLYEIKNHVARSWYFYNKALIEVKNISAYCSSGNSLALSGALNDARFYLDTSFLELDEGMKKTFEVISAEEKYLTEQKVDLIKEEALYDSEVELRQILSELNNGATSSDSYVSYYLNKVEAFNKSVLSKTTVVLAEETPFWIENYEAVEGTVLKQLGLANQGKFVFLNLALKKAVDYAESRYYSKQSLSALQNLPVFEFMLLYSNLGGSSNSAFTRFANLINRTGKNIELTQKSVDTVWEQIELKRTFCIELIEKTKNTKTYSFLAKELASFGATSSEDPLLAFDNSTKEYLKLKEEKNSGRLALGEELSRGKALLNTTQGIIKQLEWINTKLISELGSACDSKAKSITQENFSSDNESIQTLIAETNFFASKVLLTKNESKLEYCSSLIEKYNLLTSTQKDYSLIEAQKKDSAKDCIRYLESVLPESGLNELALQFENLKNQSVTKENLIIFEENCQSIKEQVENEFKSDEELARILEALKQIKENLSLMKKINTYSNEANLDKKISLLEEKLLSYEKYFDRGKLDLEEILPIKNMLLVSLNSTLFECQKTVEEKIIEYAKNNYLLVYFDFKVRESNEDINSTAKLTFPNPFTAVKAEFFAPLPFLVSAINKMDSCITEIILVDKNSSRARLGCLPLGGAAAEIVVNQKLSQSETDELIYASNKTSLLKRKITPNATVPIARALIKTSAPGGTTKCIAVVNGGEALCYLSEQNTASFVAEDASITSNINVFFYIDGLITITKTQNASNQNNVDLVEYSIKAQNNFANKIKAELCIKVAITSAVESVALFDEEFNEQKTQSGPDCIILKNQVFEAKQERNFTLRLKINSMIDYYVQVLKEQEKTLLLLGSEEQSRKTQNLLASYGTVGVAELKALVSENDSTITRLRKTNEKTQSVQLMKSALLEKIDSLRAVQSELTSLGMNKQAAEAGTLISRVLEMDLTNENTLAKAFDQLAKLSFSIESEISKECGLMETKVSALLKDNTDSALVYLQNEFLNTSEKVQKELAFDPVLAKKDFASLQNQYEKILFQKTELDKNSQGEAKNKLKLIESLSKESVLLISLLENELFSDEELIIKAKIVPPITKSRLKKLSLMINEIKSSTDTLNEKTAKLTDIRDELKKAYDSLKQHAIVSFNTAIDKGASKDTLAKAKQLIDDNSYTGALFLLSQTASKEENNFLQIGLAVPVILILLTAFGLKTGLARKEKETDAKKTDDS